MNKALAWMGVLSVLFFAPMFVGCSSSPVAKGVVAQSPTESAHAVAATTIPAQAYETLKKIDAGTWPGSATPGTHGGTVWQNREGRLPAADSKGQPAHYREWDVNNKTAGHNRDAQRIITGADGGAWYTGDHYTTFERMR